MLCNEEPCYFVRFLTVPGITVLHPTPLEEQIEKAKQDADEAARVQAAQEVVKALDEQRKKAQEAADKGLSTSPSDHPVGTATTPDAVADPTASSDESAKGTKETTSEQDSDDKLVQDLSDDRPNYFMPFPDPDGGI